MSVYTPPLRQPPPFRPDLKTQTQTLITDPRYAHADRACGAAKLAALKTAEAHKTTRATHKRKTAQVEKITWTAAQKELTCLIETAHTLFAGNLPLLTLLGLPPQAPTPHPAPGPHGVTEMLTQWHATLAGVPHLDASAQAQFALAGWPPARLNKARALLEGYLKAKIDHQTATASARTAHHLYKTALQDLETWYHQTHALPTTQE
ncbi:MAG: hypothetical protein HUU38_29490 [Anaerolineales bacterium]|nr:hypothetical protein [Anaerolineales bacterium]